MLETPKATNTYKSEVTLRADEPVENSNVHQNYRLAPNQRKHKASLRSKPDHQLRKAANDPKQKIKKTIRDYVEISHGVPLRVGTLTLQ